MSKCLSPRDTLKESADNCRKNGCWRVNSNYQPVNGVDDGILLAFDALGDGNVVYQQLFNNVGGALYVRRYWFNGWSDWVDIALKSDLTDLVIERGFSKSISIPAKTPYATTEYDVEYTVPSGYKQLAIIRAYTTGSACNVFNAYFKDGKVRLVISNLSGNQQTINAYAFILFVKS